MNTREANTLRFRDMYVFEPVATCIAVGRVIGAETMWNALQPFRGQLCICRKNPAWWDALYMLESMIPDERMESIFNRELLAPREEEENARDVMSILNQLVLAYNKAHRFEEAIMDRKRGCEDRSMVSKRRR